MNKRRLLIALLGIASVLLLVAACQGATATSTLEPTSTLGPTSEGGTEEIPFTQVISLAQAGQIQKIEVDGQNLTIYRDAEEFKSRVGKSTDILQVFRDEGVEVGPSTMEVTFKSGAGAVGASGRVSGSEGSAGGPTSGTVPVPRSAITSPSIQYTSNQQVGISVTGRGEVTAKPDLALLSIGVEARAATVVAARDQAAQAMSQIIKALVDRGIQDTDIQTRFFNISPEYRFDRENQRQELVGYRVSNQVSAKIRAIDDTGPILDEVTAAGGDLVRIQGISFTIEDRKALESLARERAVEDLMAKAQQLAQLTDVQLGKLVFLSESGGFIARPTADFRTFAEAAPAPAIETPISAGELKVTTTMQGVFSIQ